MSEIEFPSREEFEKRMEVARRIFGEDSPMADMTYEQAKEMVQKPVVAQLLRSLGAFVVRRKGEGNE